MKHWVVQSNLYAEEGFKSLIEQLERQATPYSVVKVVPFSHDMEPDVNPENPVFVCGSLSMRRVAEKKGWKPGYINAPIYTTASRMLGDEMLNGGRDTMYCQLFDVEETCLYPDERVFVRPVFDSKAFAGCVMTGEELYTWVGKVRDLCGEENSLTSITMDDSILIAPIQEIWVEYRFFVVDGIVITGSEYKRANRVNYVSVVDQEVIDYAQTQASKLNKLFNTVVLDVALTPSGFKVIEFNSINSAGFYACDMGKFVNAINLLGD